MAWIANVSALAALTAWIFWDAKFPLAAFQLRSIVAVLFGESTSLGNFGTSTGNRPSILGAVLIVAACSSLGIFFGLFLGAREHRRTRSWLLFTMLVAGWLTLLVAWPEFAWQGQRVRLRASLSEFEAIAASLRKDWPTTDGERAGLGTFMAYPQGQPRMLLMLTSDASPPISAVERADDGALLFDLQSDSGDTWLEWHPAGSTPRDFTGGLEGQYDFGRAAPLGQGWYLVRYR